MAKKGVIPSEHAFGRIAKTVKHFEGTYRDATKVGVKKVILGTRSCVNRNEVWKLKLTGTPTGGDFTIEVTVNSVTETITIAFDDTAADVKTAFATHSELVSTDLNTVGGPFPGAEIAVEFIDDFAKKRMFDSAANMPVIDDSGLTGGTSPAAWIEFPQPGYPGNGNP
jgi:hypothetical protein